MRGVEKIQRVCKNSFNFGDSTVIKFLESLFRSKDYQNWLKYGGNLEIIQVLKEAIQKIRSREHPGESQTNLPDDLSDTYMLSSIQEMDAGIKKGLDGILPCPN